MQQQPKHINTYSRTYQCLPFEAVHPLMHKRKHAQTQTRTRTCNNSDAIHSQPSIPTHTQTQTRTHLNTHTIPAERLRYAKPRMPSMPSIAKPSTSEISSPNELQKKKKNKKENNKQELNHHFKKEGIAGATILSGILI